MGSFPQIWPEVGMPLALVCPQRPDAFPGAPGPCEGGKSMLNDIRYLCRLAWSILRPRLHAVQGRGHAPRPVFVLGLVVVVLLGAGGLNEGGLTASRRRAVKVLDARVRTAGIAWREVERAYERDIEPIENVLVKYRDDQELARRIAVALVREGRKAGIEPRLLLAVLLVENPWLNPTAQSS